MEDTLKVVNGHYQLGLPWREASVTQPNNRQLAVKRLHQLKKKLNSKPELCDQYTAKIDEYISSGQARRIPNSELKRSSKSWCIPHHATGPKFPVVFDCSASYAGTFLNQNLLPGPDNTNNLLGVFCRFRQSPIAVTGDIKGMFHQVKVHPPDCDSLRFLWWPDGDTSKAPGDHQMLVHLFGAVSSPSCAGCALRQVAKDNPTLASKEALDFIPRNFYVDDWLISVDKPHHATHLTEEVCSLLVSRGFLLTKLSSDNEEVSKSFLNENEVSSMTTNLDLDKSTLQKTLGLMWNKQTDCFVFKTNIKKKPINRRGILSMLNQVFDPIGFVQPFVLPMRVLMQQLCSMKLSWDDPVPSSLSSVWQE